MSASSSSAVSALPSSNCCQEAAVPTAPLKPEQVLGVAGQAIADRRGFRRLQMRPADADVVRTLLDLPREDEQKITQPFAQFGQRCAHAQGVGIVLNVHTGSAQMEDAATKRALLREATQLGHQVVMQGRFQFMRSLDVHVVGTGPQVLDLRSLDQAGAQLGFRECHPDAAPQPTLVGLGP